MDTAGESASQTAGKEPAGSPTQTHIQTQAHIHTYIRHSGVWYAGVHCAVTEWWDGEEMKRLRSVS